VLGGLNIPGGHSSRVSRRSSRGSRGSRASSDLGVMRDRNSPTMPFEGPEVEPKRSYDFVRIGSSSSEGLMSKGNTAWEWGGAGWVRGL
jgi:hypothetical protein